MLLSNLMFHSPKIILHKNSLEMKKYKSMRLTNTKIQSEMYGGGGNYLRGSSSIMNVYNN